MEDLRKLQIIELDILKEFIRICQVHKLRYYAIGGTALGAVRHKGFIPWDDDIDVSMPREDYEKFSAIAANGLNKPYEIKTINSYENHIHPFMQIVDKRVKTIVSTANIELTHHAYIDIFPMDGLPDSKILRYLHVHLFLMLKCFFHISVFKERVNQYKERPFYERFILWFCNRFDIQKLFNKKNRVLACDRLLKKYSAYKTKYCSPQLWGQYKTKAVFPTEWLGEGVSMPFEGIPVIVPANYHEYLAQLYGSDYMEMPPVEKRVTHSSKIIFYDEEQGIEKI